MTTFINPNRPTEVFKTYVIRAFCSFKPQRTPIQPFQKCFKNVSPPPQQCFSELSYASLASVASRGDLMRRWMAILIGTIAVALVIGIAGTAYAYHMDPFYGGGRRGTMNGPIYSDCRGYGNNQSICGYPPQNANFSQAGHCCGPYGYQPQNVTPPQSGWCCESNRCRRNP